MTVMGEYGGYETLRKLRAGEVIDFEGLKLRMVPGPVGPGDLYIGARNTVCLLTCDRVNNEGRWVVPTTIDYPFDTDECIKVEEAIP